MPDWWSYTLSDFLLFSPRTYYRLLERYNQAVWPAHLAALGLGLLILVLLRQGTTRRAGVISTILAALWAWVAVAYLWRRYAEINWAVVYFLPLFGLQVILLLWTGLIRKDLRLRAAGRAPQIIGITLLAGSLLCYPGLALLAGRPWTQVELFGIAPDPTMIGTLGLVPLAEGRVRWELLPVPVLWCGFSGLTLWAMGSPEAWVPPSAAALVLLGTFRRRTARADLNVE